MRMTAIKAIRFPVYVAIMMIQKKRQDINITRPARLSGSSRSPFGREKKRYDYMDREIIFYSTNLML